MSNRILFKPVANIFINLATVNSNAGVSTSAYTQVVAAMAHASSAMEVYNGSDSTLILALGAAGFEVPLPYYVLPGKSVVLPIEISRNQRVAVKALDVTANSELLVFNFFG